MRLTGALALLVVTLGTAAPFPVRAAQEGAEGVLFRIAASQPVHDDVGRDLGKEFSCECYTADDRIVVLRIDGEAPISPSLDQESDFDGTLWLIDVGNRGAPQLVVRFHRDAGALTADLYDDQTGDGRVELESRGRETRVTESRYWSMRVVALDGYWQRAGQLAQNFDITVDTVTNATFSSQFYVGAMANDGFPDVEIRVRGPRPGDPRSYDWRNVYTPFPASSGIYRTTLMVREEGVEPRYSPIFPWYLLGATDDPTGPLLAGVLWEELDQGIVKAPGRSHPPIQVNWGLGRIHYLGEFVASRGSDYNWFTYSIKRIEPGVLTNPNFESPFAYYDLAEDHDSWPELSIRVGRFGDDRPASEVPPNGSQGVQAIRYSWDQTNETVWSFKLGLLGRQTVDGRVSFPEFELQTIPYAELPTWVTERPWPIVSFVAAERTLYTSEGIYDWDITRATGNYFGGTAGPPPTTESAFGELGGGLRGDYSLNYHRAPRLTFNPIDRKLHLAWADGGIWNLLDGRQVRFLNLSGGLGFDGWQVWDGERLISQLYRVPGGLLYSDDRQTLFLRVELADELFSAAPPTNNAEWIALGEQLDRHAADFEPGNLRAMFDRFPGTPIRIANGPIDHFVRDGSGVRFAVDVTDELSRDVLTALTGIRPWPGLQVVSLVDDRWTLERGTFDSPAFAVDHGSPEVYRETHLRVTVLNDGSMLLEDAALSVEAVAADGRRFVLLDEVPIEIEGHGERTVTVQWSPRTVGEWKLELTLVRSSGTEWSSQGVVLAEDVQPFTVAPGARITFGSALALGWPGAGWERLLVTVGFLVLTVAIVRAGLRWRDANR